MIRRNNDTQLKEYRKNIFRIVKKNKWLPFLYMINNIIEKRCNGKPFYSPPLGYNGKEPLYGIDYNIALYSKGNNYDQFIIWLEDWVNMLKRKKITHYDSITKDI